MIPREDFALLTTEPAASHEQISSISVRDFQPSIGLIGPSLRKPDFQRETNHWDPGQVVSLLECFANGDLIPSVILWRSPTVLFVIDGGHRLSVLRAWIEDDYGDGPVSRNFFGNAISREQLKAAEQTRSLIAKAVGSWKHLQASVDNKNLTETERRKINTVGSRAIPVQWVHGNAEKAEASFFKINTKGTPLDDIEELLLQNRKKPIAIASRAVIRAGMGHRYWSGFKDETGTEVQRIAKSIHQTLFEPEVDTPVKTLELPLGGSTGVRSALQVLIDFILAATRGQDGSPKSLADQSDDDTGDATIQVLNDALALASRITGNDRGSLGLHPAIYFYGPTGRHVGPMFLGLATLIGRKLTNNDKGFFANFTRVRGKLEALLIDHKDLIGTIMQRTISRYRSETYARLIEGLINDLLQGNQISDADFVKHAGLTGKIITGTAELGGERFSDETKSAVFIRTALQSAMKCPICSGYLDPQKSVSYDHIEERASGGKGTLQNCQLTHPYCNQAVKNRAFQGSATGRIDVTNPTPSVI